MLKNMIGAYFCVMCALGIISNARALTQTLALQQSSTVALGQTATYFCAANGSGPDPSFFWRVRQFPSRTITQDLSSQAITPEMDTDPNDGFAKSQISFVVTSSLLDNKEIWCSAVDSGSVTAEIYTSITPTIQPASTAASTEDDGVSTGTIIAIVVGIIFFILLLILIIICCCSYGWCREKEKVQVEPTIVEQPKNRPYIPSIASEESEPEPVYSSPRYYPKPAKDSGPIISMYDNSYETPRAHQLPALDSQHLYTDKEPRKLHKKRRKKKTRRPHHEEPMIQEMPRREPDDEDLVVVPGGRDSPNYFE